MKIVRRILLTIFISFMMIITLGVVAYAWVSLATITNIDGLGLTASAGDDLELSVDGINFYNQLPTSELTEIFEDIKLNAVTTSDNINFTTGGLYGTNPAIANEHYLSFDLWIRTTRRERGVYLFNNVNDKMSFYKTSVPGTYAVSRGVYWMANESFQNGVMPGDIVQKGSIDQYFAHDAIRIGIKELIDDLNPLDLRNDDELQNLIYDPSENIERGFGQPFGAYSYFFNRTLIFLYLPNQFPNTTYRLSQMEENNPYQAKDNNSLVATLQPTDYVDETGRLYFQSKIRINIWVEGWDPDAFDAIDRDTVKIQLQFKAAHIFKN